MHELILDNVRSKFQRARELCPGMSEEVYALTDYLGKYANDRLDPDGMTMVFLLVQGDLLQGRCGLAGSDNPIPKEFLTQREQLESQFCYILQVVDAIADEEYAEAVRDKCQRTLGWVVPKQVKINDQLPYPPYVMAAVDWWTNAVYHPKMDDGSGFMSLVMLLRNEASAKGPTEKAIRKFRKVLAKGIMSRMRKGYNPVILMVDYHPGGALAEAGKAAKMRDLSFPCKTTMEVRKTIIKVSAGYQAPYETIWQA